MSTQSFPAIGRISLVVPAADMEPADRQLVVAQAAQATYDLYMRDGTLQNQAPSLRALNAVDLGESTRVWNEQVSTTQGAFENSEIANQSTSDQIACSIYGVYVASMEDAVTGLRFTIGGRRTHVWDLFPVMSDKSGGADRLERTMFSWLPQNRQSDPVLIGPNTSITIEQYIRGGTGGLAVPSVEIIFLGLVVEPLGGGNESLQPPTEHLGQRRS